MLLPIGDRVLVEPIEEPEQTVSGIILVDSAKDNPTRGKIVAVGAGAWHDGGRIPLTVAVGDTVIYSRYGGAEVSHEGRDYLMMRESDILAVVVDES